jgi:hypothetical protein
VNVLTYPGVGAVSESDWNRLDPRGQLFQSRAWLLANEHTLSGKPLVTIAHFDGEPGSAIVWRLLDAEDPSPYYNIVSLIGRFSARPEVRAGRTLNCTGSGMHSSILSAPGRAMTPDEVSWHLDAATAAIGEAPSMTGMNFVSPDPVAGLEKALVTAGFVEFKAYRRATLDLAGAGYEDYLSALTSRQRWSVRRDRRRYAETGQHISYGTGPAAGGDDLIHLQGLNRLKYGLPHDVTELREKHDLLLRTFGDNALVVRSHGTSATTGFAMFFRMADTLHALFAGFEESGGRAGSYFECLFYAAVDWACDNGIRHIDYGIGSIEAKAERGCRIDDVSSWYRPGRSVDTRPGEEDD